MAVPTSPIWALADVRPQQRLLVGSFGGQWGRLESPRPRQGRSKELCRVALEGWPVACFPLPGPEPCM